MKVSERRICRVLGQHRSTQRRLPQGRADEELLVADMIELSRQYGRYDYVDMPLLAGYFIKLPTQGNPGCSSPFRPGKSDWHGQPRQHHPTRRPTPHSIRSQLHRATRLYDETRHCVFAPSQIGVEGPIDLQKYVDRGHVVRSLSGNSQSVIDTRLAEIGLSRRVMLSTPRFSTLPILLQSAPLIATLPSRMITYCMRFGGLQDSPLPIETPDIRVNLVSHARHDGSAAHLWLAGLIVRAAADSAGA